MIYDIFHLYNVDIYKHDVGVKNYVEFIHSTLK